MNARLLTPADYRTMPWKNGHGITHEIAVERSEDDRHTGGFAWRLSMAEVAVSAPFSVLPGIDRILLLLEGDGMVLDRGAEGSYEVVQKFEPFAFPGEWSIDCRLVGSPCCDFNVMVDRRRVRAQVEVLTVGTEPQRVTIAGQTVALVALTGKLRVATHSSLPEYEYELGTRHTLIVSEADQLSANRQLTVAGCGSAATALWIGFTRLAEAA